MVQASPQRFGIEMLAFQKDLTLLSGAASLQAMIALR
jgi:hypothetical protein